MARKRLNKKVAIIGAVLFALLAMAVMGLLFYKSRNPSPFIADGDKAVEAKNYEQAIKSYTRAIGLAKADTVKISTLYKLADVYYQIKDWPRVLGSWEGIIQIDPANARIRFERLRYFYELANSGASAYWQEVGTQVDDFFSKIDNKVLSENPANWKSIVAQGPEQTKRVDTFLYLLRARTLIEKARTRQTSSFEQSYSQAKQDLQKAMVLEPNNINVFSLLAQTLILEGRDLSAKQGAAVREKGQKDAIELLQRCVALSPSEPKAHQNLLGLKLIIADQNGPEEVNKLEPDFEALVQKFPNDASSYAALTNLYLLLSPEKIDKAAQAAERALQLDSSNFHYTQTASVIYLYQYAIHERQTPSLYAKSIDLAKKASMMSEAQEVPGAQRWAYLENRRQIYEFLANRYLEQILYPLEPLSEQNKQRLIKDTEDAVSQLQIIAGSGDHPEIIKWRGLLDVAKGNTQAGVRTLNTIYEQATTASGQNAGIDPIVPYVLAKVYENSNEQGAVLNYFASAISSGISRFTRPEALLEFCQTSLKLGLWKTTIDNVDIYNRFFHENQKSRSLKILGLIGEGDFEQAEKLIAAEPQDDPNTINLNIAMIRSKINQARSSIAQAHMSQLETTISGTEPNAAAGTSSQQDSLEKQLASLIDSLSQALAKQAKISPNSIDEPSISIACEDLIANGKTSQAKELIDVLLKNSPSNITANFFKGILSEPQPDKVDTLKRRQIEEQVYNNLPDPSEKAFLLGILYNKASEPAKAAEQFKIVLGDFLKTSPQADKLLDIKLRQRKELAVGSLFDAVIKQQDWKTASEIADAAKTKNLDGCDGLFFAARLAAARKDKSALTLFDDCIKQRPVFSYGYLFRSNMRASLNDESEAIEDAKKALTLNPQDGVIAKNIANLLYVRNQRLGRNATITQNDELKSALDIAMRINSNDLDLISFYAEFISQTDPKRAISIRQYLLQSDPSIQNAILLGRMVTRIASSLPDSPQKTALFNIAKSAFEQGKAIEPANQTLLASITEMYIAMGNKTEAEKFITQAKDRTLLWLYYYQNRQYDQAQKILNSLYQTNSKDPNVLRGLVSVAEKTLNKDDVLRYSRELIDVNDSIENRLLQMQSLVNTGLFEQAQNNLNILKDKFPGEQKTLYIEASMLTMQGNLDKALDLANQAIEKDKNYLPPWQLRGRIYLMRSDYAKAASDFEHYKLYSNDPVNSVLLARSYLGQGRDDLAITELKIVVDNPSVSLEAAILLENIFTRLKRPADLAQLYTNLINKNPDNVFWINRAAGYALSVKNYKDAEQLYEQALNKRTDSGSVSSDAFGGYLDTLILSGQTDKLFTEANKHINDELAPVAYIKMADAENKRNNTAAAVKYARSAADSIKNNDTQLYQILKTMVNVIGPKNFEDYANEKLQQNPKSLSVLRVVYELKLSTSDYNKAIETIDKCIEITQNDPNMKFMFIAQKASAYYTAFSKTSDKNYIKKAIVEYESALNEMPKNIRRADILNNLAYMLAASDERLDDALKYAEESYRLGPGNPNYLDTYAFVLYKKGGFSEALQHVQSAIQLFTMQQMKIDWSVYEHAALISEKTGAQSQALAFYKQALQAGQNEMNESEKTAVNAAIERLSKVK